MTRWMRCMLMTGFACGLLTCGAMAATEGYTTDVDGVVDYSNGSYTATYSEAQSGQQYALLVVKGSPDNYVVSDETIMYIDQKAADSSGVSFSFIPKSTPECVVLLGGQFADGTSPKVLGTLISQGVTVRGTVTLQGRTNYSGATVTLTGENGTFTGTTLIDGSYTLDSVPAGTYTLKITKDGYLSHTITNMRVENDINVSVKNLTAGDLNQDGYVNAADLSLLIQEFGSSSQNPPSNWNCDFNNDQSINAADLSILITSFGHNSELESDE